MLVMRKKKLLAGIKVYINNDLTREQMYQEKQLRTKRRELLSWPSFEGTRIRVNFGLMVAPLPAWKASPELLWIEEQARVMD